MHTSNKSRIVIALVILGVITAGVLWELRSPPVIQAPSHPTTISPKKNQDITIQSEISGKILAIYVKNNQRVKRDDMLIALDPTEFQLTLEQAKAQLAKAQYQSKTAALAVQEAQALVAQREAELSHQEALFKKKDALAVKGYYPKQQLLEASTQVKTATAAVTLAKTHLALEKTRTISDPEVTESGVLQAMNEVKQAQLNLDRTQIKAPIDGIIGDFALYPNQIISAHQPLCNLQPTKKAVINGLREVLPPSSLSH